jgi:hypothetical protein
MAQLDLKKYGKRLAKTLPVVIETEEENERMLAEVNRLMDKEGNSSATKRHKRHKREKDGNEPDEASKIDSGSPPCCSRCAFCAFLWLCLSSYQGRAFAGGVQAVRSDGETDRGF